MHSYLPAGVGRGGDRLELKRGEAVLRGRQGVRLQRGDHGDRAGVQATQSRRVGSEGRAWQEMQMKTLLVLLHDWGTVFPWAGQTHQVFIISELRFQKH